MKRKEKTRRQIGNRRAFSILVNPIYHFVRGVTLVLIIVAASSRRHAAQRHTPAPETTLATPLWRGEKTNPGKGEGISLVAASSLPPRSVMPMPLRAWYVSKTIFSFQNNFSYFLKLHFFFLTTEFVFLLKPVKIIFFETTKKQFLKHCFETHFLKPYYRHSLNPKNP